MRDSIARQVYDIRSVVRGVMHFATYNDLSYVEDKLTELLNICEQEWERVNNDECRTGSISLESA